MAGKRIRTLLPVVQWTAVELNGTNADTTASHASLVLSSNLLATLSGGPWIITPGNPAAVVGSFNLPAGLQIKGGVYVRVNFTVVNHGGSVTQIATQATDSTGEWAGQSPVYILEPATETNVTEYLLQSLDPGVWLPTMTPDAPTSPIGSMIVSLWATCDAADTLTINSVELLGSYVAQLPILGP
jgi:hypothetical protein